MATDDCPRDRLLRAGPQSLSDAELVAVLIRSGSRADTTAEVAARILRMTGGLAGLVSANGNLKRQPGIGPARAATVLAAVELARRLARGEVTERRLLDDPESVACYLRLRYGQAEQEVLGAVFLDVHNRLITEREIFRGTLTRAAVEPRAVLKEALWCRASYFVVFHTHPSGDPTPSAEDIAFTRRMDLAGRLLGIKMVDHLIVGNGGRWVSLKRRGGW